MNTALRQALFFLILSGLACDPRSWVPEDWTKQVDCHGPPNICCVYNSDCASHLCHPLGDSDKPDMSASPKSSEVIFADNEPAWKGECIPKERVAQVNSKNCRDDGAEGRPFCDFNKALDSLPNDGYLQVCYNPGDNFTGIEIQRPVTIIGQGSASVSLTGTMTTYGPVVMFNISDSKTNILVTSGELTSFSGLSEPCDNN